MHTQNLRSLLIRSVASLAAPALLLIGAQTAAAVSISELSGLVIFGDSIVDAGNTQNLLGGAIFPSCASTGGVPPCDVRLHPSAISTAASPTVRPPPTS